MRVLTMTMFWFVICNLIPYTCAANKGREGAALQLADRGICAHRGAKDTHPENTLAAFREAIRLGAHMIELDASPSKDGELVVMHDLTVDRTTDGSGKISELTLAELKSLDAGGWKHPIFKGERIPTLAEALAIMPRNIWINVHLKAGEETGRKAAQLIVAENRTHQAFLACGISAAQAARKVCEGIQICNMESQGNSLQYVNETIAMGASFIQLAGGKVSPDHTRKLREAGVHVNYFGTTSADEVRELFAAGVEFPLVDNPAEMIKVAEELGIVPLKPSW
jgi:glycerophosphoryl diester phosphodiesterase